MISYRSTKLLQSKLPHFLFIWVRNIKTLHKLSTLFYKNKNDKLVANKTLIPGRVFSNTTFCFLTLYDQQVQHLLLIDFLYARHAFILSLPLKNENARR